METRASSHGGRDMHLRIGAAKAIIVILAVFNCGHATALVLERQYLVAGRHNSLPDAGAVAAAGGVWIDQIKSIGVAIVKSSDPGFLKRVRKAPSVELAAPDFEVRIPDDAPSLEGMDVIAEGQPLTSTSNDPLSVLEWDNMVIGANAAHDRGITGEGVTIAVVDTGIDKTHPDLVTSVIETGISFDPSDPNPFPTVGGLTDQGHGTAVAGIIAATCGNGIGVCGVAPGARLLSVRVWNGVQGFPMSRYLQSFDWASSVGVSLYGVKIINASNLFRCDEADQNCQDELIPALGIANRMITEVHRRGVVIFGAAGNQGIDVSQDASFKAWPAGNNVETVGATGPCCAACDGDPLNDADYDLLTGYTNYGFAQEETNYFVMPGGQTPLRCSYPSPNSCTVASPLGPLTTFCQRFDMIWTTSLQNPLALLGRYIPFSGTSSATPQASGLAALWLSRFPDLTVGQLIDAIHGSAVDLGNPGYDLNFGYGRGTATAIP